MTRGAWIGILFGAGLGTGACTLTLGFDGLAGENREGGAEERNCADPKNAQKADCNVVAGHAPGSIGTGFTLDWKTLPEKEVVGGFIDGNRLVLAIHIADAEGIVMSVDLETGERRLASGEVNDATGTPLKQGPGPGLQELRALRAKDAGTWIAHLWPNRDTFDGSLVPISALDGTRSGGFPLSSECPGYADGVYPRSGTEPLIAQSGDAVWIAYHSTYPATDGTTIDGVVRISATECKLFPTPGIEPNLLAEQDGRIWMLDGSSLQVLDPTTEKITPVAAGELGDRALSVTNAWAWTIDQEVSLSYIRIDTSSGDHQPLLDVTGPASLQVEHPPLAWLHPNGNDLVLALDGAVVILDPTTGKSHFVSY